MEDGKISFPPAFSTFCFTFSLKMFSSTATIFFFIHFLLEQAEVCSPPVHCPNPNVQSSFPGHCSQYSQISDFSYSKRLLILTQLQQQNCQLIRDICECRMIFSEQLCLDMMKCAPEEEHNWPTPSFRIKHDAHLFSLSFLGEVPQRGNQVSQ